MLHSLCSIITGVLHKYRYWLEGVHVSRCARIPHVHSSCWVELFSPVSLFSHLSTILLRLLCGLSFAPLLGWSCHPPGLLHPTAAFPSGFKSTLDFPLLTHSTQSSCARREDHWSLDEALFLKSHADRGNSAPKYHRRGFRPTVASNIKNSQADKIRLQLEFAPHTRLPPSRRTFWAGWGKSWGWEPFWLAEERKTDRISARLCNVVGMASQKGCKHQCSEVGQASSLPGNKYFGHRDRKLRGWPCEQGKMLAASRKYAKRQEKSKQSTLGAADRTAFFFLSFLSFFHLSRVWSWSSKQTLD